MHACRGHQGQVVRPGRRVRDHHLQLPKGQHAGLHQAGVRVQVRACAGARMRRLARRRAARGGTLPPCGRRPGGAARCRMQREPNLNPWAGTCRRDNFEALEAAGFKPYGISADKAKSQVRRARPRRRRAAAHASIQGSAAAPRSERPAPAAAAPRPTPAPPCAPPHTHTRATPVQLAHQARLPIQSAVRPRACDAQGARLWAGAQGGAQRALGAAGDPCGARCPAARCPVRTGPPATRSRGRLPPCTYDIRGTRSCAATSWWPRVGRS